MNGDTLGARIKSTREEQKMTQKKLAETINMSQQNLIRIEKDEVNPSVVTLENISKALKVTPNDLLGIMKYGQETPLSINFKNLRYASGDTTYEFGDKLGISGKIVSEIETGESLPNRELFDRILKEFNITEEELLKPVENINISTSGRKILDIIERKNAVIENARTVADVVDHIEAYSYDSKTDTFKDKIITSEMQAKELIENAINLQNKSLDEIISIYEFVCDLQIKELSKDI